MTNEIIGAVKKGRFSSMGLANDGELGSTALAAISQYLYKKSFDIKDYLQIPEMAKHFCSISLQDCVKVPVTNTEMIINKMNEAESSGHVIPKGNLPMEVRSFCVKDVARGELVYPPGIASGMGLVVRSKETALNRIQNSSSKKEYEILEILSYNPKPRLRTEITGWYTANKSFDQCGLGYKKGFYKPEELSLKIDDRNIIQVLNGRCLCSVGFLAEGEQFAKSPLVTWVHCILDGDEFFWETKDFYPEVIIIK